MAVSMDTRTPTPKIATYPLSAHNKWNGSEHECKGTNTTDTATYTLSTHKE